MAPAAFAEGSDVPSSMLRASALLAAFAATLAASPAAAQPRPAYLAKPMTVGGNPGPAHNYVCPNADGGPALECFLDAVRHLYTMCKHVKSIEIIEFGYEASEDGTNGKKSEFCVEKQKANIARPFQVAMKEAAASKAAVQELRELHAYWLDALSALRWRAGEPPDDYLFRTALVYPSFDDRVGMIRVLVEEARRKPAKPQRKARR